VIEGKRVRASSICSPSDRTWVRLHDRLAEAKHRAAGQSRSSGGVAAPKRETLAVMVSGGHKAGFRGAVKSPRLAAIGRVFFIGAKSPARRDHELANNLCRPTAVDVVATSAWPW